MLNLDCLDISLSTSLKKLWCEVLLEVPIWNGLAGRWGKFSFVILRTLFLNLQLPHISWILRRLRGDSEMLDLGCRDVLFPLSSTHPFALLPALPTLWKFKLWKNRNKKYHEMSSILPMLGRLLLLMCLQHMIGPQQFRLRCSLKDILNCSCILTYVYDIIIWKCT